MMNRVKQRKKALTVLLAAMLAGCGTARNDTTKLMTAGTYEGTGTGENGDIKVSVTLTTTAITGVAVTAQQETAGIADDALSSVPQEILDNQSLNVDLATGATATSKGIIEAVGNAITQAGGNPDEWNTDKTGTSKKAEPVKSTTQVVVVGSGASGLTAALRLEQLGIKTTLLEKNSYLGGSLAYTDGSQIVTGSAVQTEELEGTDTIDSLGQDLMVYGSSTGNADLIRVFAENAGTTTDWMVNDLGVDFDIKKGLISDPAYGFDRILAYSASADKVSKLLTDEVEVSGAKLLKNTRAISLKTENGAVTGVLARSSEGKLYDITADAVILATGGAGANQSLVSDSLKDTLYGGTLTSTGDAIILGREDTINAAVTSMEDAQYSYAGVSLGDGIGVMTDNANKAAMNEGMIFVNSSGSRFVNETATDSVILGAEMMQTNQVMYAVMTQSAFTAWTQELGKRLDLSDQISAWLDDKQYFEGDTIEEAAEKAMIDPNMLKATADAFDADPVDSFGRVKGDEKFEDSSHYYIVRMQPCYVSTLGGLVTDSSFQVMNQSGTAISGLYAVGEAVGGVFGASEARDAGVTWAFTSGKTAADGIAEMIAGMPAEASASADASASAEAADASASPSAAVK